MIDAMISFPQPKQAKKQLRPKLRLEDHTDTILALAVDLIGVEVAHLLAEPEVVRTFTRPARTVDVRN